MGQSFVICNLDKQQYITPSAFNDGENLREFGQSSRGTMTALAALTAQGNGLSHSDFCKPTYGTTPSPTFDIVGSWAGDRIVTAGEYATAGVFLTKAQQRQLKRRVPDGLENLYAYAYLHYFNVSQLVIEVLRTCKIDGYHEGSDEFDRVLDRRLRNRAAYEFRRHVPTNDLRWLSYTDLQIVLLGNLFRSNQYHLQLCRYLLSRELLSWQRRLIEHFLRYVRARPPFRNYGAGVLLPQELVPDYGAGSPLELPPLLLAYIQQVRPATPTTEPPPRTRVIDLPPEQLTCR
jgi:hypothetical protein